MRGTSTAHNKLSMLSLSRVGGSANGPPSSGLYERLETGDETEQRHAGQGQQRVPFAWKKFAIGAAILIGLVWLVGPRERRSRIFGSSSGTLAEVRRAAVAWHAEHAYQARRQLTG